MRQSRVERLDDCIATPHRMLGIDPCCEDEHRLLMRCYTSQGRNYQAARQYDFCLRMLKRNLEVNIHLPGRGHAEIPPCLEIGG
jgi:two-component SAPR family response regulator